MNNLAEFMVTAKSIELCFHIGFKKVHLEGDLMVVINAICQNHTLDWKLNKWVGWATKLLSLLDDFKISHIHREGNEEADNLTKKGSMANH